MCGLMVIAGDRARDERGVRRAMDRLRLRGPDASDVWRDLSAPVLIGHARLAINDTSDAGLQPMVLGRQTLVCNGEIYNAPALRAELEREGAEFRSTCDVEVLLHARASWGFEETLRRIEGMYAFVIWDAARRTIEAAVDHAGLKPLAYALRGGTLFIASDVDAVRGLLDGPTELDATSLCHVLCCGYVPAPRTAWEGIAKLGPGRAMRWRPEQAIEVWTHWRAPEGVGPLEASAEGEQFESLWEGVVADHLLSDVPVGMFLSGGIDSTSVALALSRLGRRDVKAYTLGLDGPDDESGAAGETAAHLGLEHEVIRFGADDARETMLSAARVYDEPQAFGALLTATRLAGAAREHGKVMIAGDGGDEAFAGYPWHREPISPVTPNVERHGALAACVGEAGASGEQRRTALGALATLSATHAHLQRVFPRFHPAEACSLLRELAPRYDEHTYAGWATEHAGEDRTWPRWAQRLDLATFCAGSILPKVDRAAMGVGLEVRAPMLDRRLLTLALGRRVRPEERDGATARPIVRDYLRGRVPPGVLERKKQGFSLRLGAADPWTPMASWLDSTRLVRDGVLRRDWRPFATGDVPHAQARLFALLFLAAWYEERV
jgi:asparagine synthase (glutamine-hydrolysing)